LGGLTSLDAAERMMHEADVEGDGQIDMDELTLMMEKK
jgi:Ca2+-binding EF-hand superfamily protein